MDSTVQSSNWCADRRQSHRTLRDGSVGGAIPRHFVPGYDRNVPPGRAGRYFATAFKHLHAFVVVRRRQEYLVRLVEIVWRTRLEYGAVRRTKPEIMGPEKARTEALSRKVLLRLG